MASNFQRVGEVAPARYKEKGLEYFMQAPMLAAELKGSQQRVFNGLDIDETGLSQQDLPKAQQMGNFINKGKEKFADKILEGGTLSNSEITQMLKLVQHNKQYNKELEAGVKGNEERKAYVKQVEGLMMKEGANVPYYQTILNNANTKWKGSMGPDGSDFSLGLDNVPKQVDILKNYRSDLSIAMEHMPPGKQKELDDLKYKINIEEDAKVRVMLQQKVYKLMVNSPAIKAVEDRYRKALRNTDTDMGAMASYIGDKYIEGIEYELKGIAGQFLREKEVDAGISASMSNIPQKSKNSGSGDVSSVKHISSGNNFSDNGTIKRLSTNQMKSYDIDDSEFDIVEKNLTPENLKYLNHAQMVFKGVAELSGEFKGDKATMDKVNKNLTDAGLPTISSSDAAGMYIKASILRSKETVTGTDYTKYNTAVTTNLNSIFGKSKQVVNEETNTTEAGHHSILELQKMILGKTLLNAEQMADAGVYPDMGFINSFKTNAGARVENLGSALDVLKTDINLSKNLQGFNVIDGLEVSKEVREAALDSDNANHKLATKIIDAKQDIGKRLGKLYNEYYKDIKVPFYTSKIGFTQEYIDGNNVTKVANEYTEKYAHQIATDLNANKKHFLKFTYNKGKDGVDLTSGSTFDIQDTNGGVADGVTIANAIEKGIVGEPVMIGSNTDLANILPEMAKGKEKDISELNELYNNALMYKFNVKTGSKLDDGITDEFKTMYVLVENSGSNKIPDSTGDIKVVNNSTKKPGTIYTEIRDLRVGGTTKFTYEGPSPGYTEQGDRLPGKARTIIISQSAPTTFVFKEVGLIDLGDGTAPKEGSISNHIQAGSKEQLAFELGNYLGTNTAN